MFLFEVDFTLKGCAISTLLGESFGVFLFSPKMPVSPFLRWWDRIYTGHPSDDLRQPTPTYPRSISQASPNPQMKWIPSWGMFLSGYVGKFLGMIIITMMLVFVRIYVSPRREKLPNLLEWVSWLYVIGAFRDLTAALKCRVWRLAVSNLEKDHVMYCNVISSYHLSSAGVAAPYVHLISHTCFIRPNTIQTPQKISTTCFTSINPNLQFQKRIDSKIKLLHVIHHLGVSKNRGKTPQNGWFIMENPIYKNGWFGGVKHPYFWKHPFKFFRVFSSNPKKHTHHFCWRWNRVAANVFSFGCRCCWGRFVRFFFGIWGSGNWLHVRSGLKSKLPLFPYNSYNRG